MLIDGIVPREMHEYAKLLRTIRVGEQWTRLEAGVSGVNRDAMRFYKVLRAAEGLPAETSTPGRPPAEFSTPAH